MFKPVVSLALCTVLLGGAGPARGQAEFQNLTPEPDPYAGPLPESGRLPDPERLQDETQINPNVYRAFLGKPVLTENGRSIGVVVDFVFNTVANEVEAALVELADSSGLGGRVAALPWPALSVDTERNALIADMALPDIAALDPFDPDTLASPKYETLEDPLLDTAEE